MITTCRIGPKAAGLLCLIVTASGWALNWPLMKLLLRSWPPLFARGFAGVVAALILAAIAARRGQPLGVPRGTMLRLAFASFTNVFAWMGLRTIAMRFVSVGEGALIAYTMPIWAMLLAWPLSKLRPSLSDIVALVLGLAGIFLLLWGDGFSLEGDKLIGVGLALACAIFFALGNVLNGRLLSMPTLVVVAWQVGMGCSVMLVLGMLFERPNYASITATGLACFAYMTLIPMGICYLTWFEALRRLPAVSASTGLLVVPVIAMVAAAVILGEPFGIKETAAIVLTLGGVALALQKPQSPIRDRPVDVLKKGATQKIFLGGRQDHPV